MFRPMRRKNREIPREQAQAVLKTARWGVLAMNGENGYPYAIPLNFRYDENEEKIYFHGARAGYKAEAIRACDQVCFTACGEETVKQEAWAPFVKSAVAYGRCHPVEDRDVAMEQLRRLAGKYLPDAETVEAEMVKAGKTAQMYVIEIEHLTGKEIQER